MRARRRRLIASTSLRKVSAWSTPSSPARAMKARMSLGRQPPPKPSPACRKRPPIRVSYDSALVSCVTSPPVASHTSAIALMKEILVARKALAATLTSSAVAKSVTTTGAAWPWSPSMGGVAPRAAAPRARSRAGRRRPAGRGGACPRPRSPRAGTPGSRPARSPRRGAAAICVGQPRGRPGRHGRLADHERAVRRCGMSAVKHGVDVGHVGGVLALLLRRAHADEVHVAERAGLLVRGGEAQPARSRGSWRSSSAQAGLEEGHLARAAAPVDLGRRRRPCRAPRSRARPCRRRAWRRGSRCRGR